jgi:hypothetical protein
MLTKLCLVLSTLLCSMYAAAQNKSEVKNYPAKYAVGEVNLLQQWVESDGIRSYTIYAIEVPVAGMYTIAAITNLQKGTTIPIQVDAKTTTLRITATESGWQKIMVNHLEKQTKNAIFLTLGRHQIKLGIMGNMPPLVDAISLSRTNTHNTLDKDWEKFSARLSQWKMEIPTNHTPANDKLTNAGAEKVLANPSGNYEHEVDAAFTYSTFQYIYLVAGSTYTFATTGSTIDPVLHLFSVTNVDGLSWASDDYNGNWESNLVVTITVSGSYYLLARPYYASQSGTTNIIQNGVTLLTNTPIAGQRYSTNPRTGNLNYFTAKLTGNTIADTRIFTFPYSGGAVTAYNDDYYNTSGGTWLWSLASRIKKNYTTSSNIVYVCAYSATRNGTCDIYMGNTTATLPTSGEASNFPLLKGEDAIQSAESTGGYNCIAWSGGITTSWVWPIDNYSTWYVANNPLASFDKFYSNNPVRYAGAWNYTRTGATAATSVVDLWKTASAYTHASVTKPGNDNPHGYDWESKPGNFDRTMHPRNALENASWYGSVSNYYVPTGTFARTAGGITSGGFATDVEAVKAGVAVIDKAILTTEAQEKLRILITKLDNNFIQEFEELYTAWDKTKVQNASLSDPSMYCRNAEFENLATLSKKNSYATMLLVFDKFVNKGDHFLSTFLWTLTKDKYEKLLTEVKTERAANPNDKQGRYRVHGNHDNGVLHIEKILKQLDAQTALPTAEELITITVSPNPVKNQFTIVLNLKTAGQVSIQAISTQSKKSMLLKSESTLAAGVHKFTAFANDFNAAVGDVITLQVKVNGVVHSAKVMVL